MFHLKEKLIITKKMLLIFTKEEKAVAAIEMAFVLPLLISLTMSFIEYAVVFSVRSGLENINRDVARMKQALTGNDNTVLTAELHKQIVKTVTNPKNVVLRSYVVPPFTVAPMNQEFYQIRTLNLLTEAGTPTSTRNITSATTAPAALNLGDSLDYVAIEIIYNHQYLTPITQLIGLGTSIKMQTMTIFQKEDES